MESTDLSPPQGMPSADSEPHAPVSLAASEVAESSGSGALQDLPPEDEGPETPPSEYVSSRSILFDFVVGDQVVHAVNVIMRGTVPKIIQKEDLMTVKDTGRGGYRSEGLHSLDGYGRIAYMILNGTQTRRKALREMRHRRVVYQEYGTPIDKVKRLSVAITVLHGVTEALKHIHAAKWVHRDISACNIYAYGGRGLLTDFEYAKKMGTEAAHEVKTGTLYFMPFEAIERAYYYYEEDVLYEPITEFFPNVIHDMESLLWVLLFLLKDVECKDEKAQDSRILIDCNLFIAAMSRSAARFFFVTSISEALRAYGLLLGIDGREIYVRVGKLRAILRQYYRASEAQLPEGPIDITKFSGIHEEFLTIWGDCQVFLAKQDKLLKVMPAVILPPPAPKRKAETELQHTRESKTSRTQPILQEDEMSIERI